MNIRRAQIITTLAMTLMVGGFVLMPYIASAQTAPAAAASTASAPSIAGSVAAGIVGGAAGTAAGPAVAAGTGAATGGFFSSFSIVPYINSAIEFFFNNVAMPVANMFLQLTGFLLNATMTVTLNMNALVSASGGIVDSTWSIIRDVSSILIIFFLLYTSIEIIIGISDSKVQHLIIMVAVAGILINFSLFFTKVAVDASNLVSLAFYRAITPTGSAQWDGTGDYLGIAEDGGLSNVFMNALELQTFYTAGTSNTGTAVTASPSPIAVIAAGIGGVVVMVIAALSFLAAAILFAVRIGFLIILMAFSPVYFVGMIVPGIKTKMSDRWRNALISQCLIMPVYLLFMYVALRVITNPTFKNVLNPAAVANANAGATSLLVSPSTVGTVIQYIISIILISIPLLAAMEYASVGKDFANSAVSKVKGWGKTGLQRGWQGAYQGTVGRAASKVATSEGFKDFAARDTFLGRNVGQAALKATRGVAQGYNKKLEEQVKSRTEFGESLGFNQHALSLAEEQLRRFRSVKTTRGKTLTPQNRAVLDQQIMTAETQVNEIKNARKQSFASATNSRSIDALFTKVTRKDKVASAKMQAPVFEARIKEHEKNVDDNAKNITELNDKKKENEDKISEIQADTNEVTDQIVPGTPPTPEQQAKLNKLASQLIAAGNQRSKLTDQIDAANSTKRYLDAQRTTINSMIDRLKDMKDIH